MNKEIIKESLDDEVSDIYIPKDKNVVYQALDLPGKKRVFHIAANASLELLELNTKANDRKLEVYLDEEGATFNASTLTVGDEGIFNYYQAVYHNAKNTTSNITNFAISLGKSNITFKTIGNIKNKMSNSNCRQLSKGIIISDESSITSEPILLIDEYDVFASHGASIGKMSDDELFYLMSRGLSKDEALKLIVGGLINPFLERLSEEDKNNFMDLIHNKIKD